LILHHKVKLVIIAVSTELLDWGTIPVYVKQQYQKHQTLCTCKCTAVKEATTSNDKGKCLLH